MTETDTKALITATVVEVLWRMGVRAPWKRERPARPRKARGPNVAPPAVAPSALVAWLAERERVTLLEAMPVLGLAPGKRGASFAGIAMSAAGWHRVGRENLPGGVQVWFYERRQTEPSAAPSTPE